MIETVIQRLLSFNRNPRVHPNGFIQLDLDKPVETNSGHSGGHTRLHIWTDKLPRQKTRTAIHDHVFDMSSYILLGTLDQQRVKVGLNAGDHGFTHEILLPDYRTSSSQLNQTGVFCVVHGNWHKVVFSGQSYTQPAFTFHESVPKSATVATVMRKTKVHEGVPRVLMPLEAEEPDNEFDRHTAAPVQLLWEIIEDAVDRMATNQRDYLVKATGR